MTNIKANHPWRQEYFRKLKTQKRKRDFRPEPTRPMPAHCELCTQPRSKLVLDHCHDSGNFRGWLCSTCNTGLGALGDNLAGVRAAVAYLERCSESLLKSTPRRRVDKRLRTLGYVR